MKLKELNNFNLEVVRDDNFQSLGYLFHKNKKMLVFIEDENFIENIDPKFVSCVITNKKLKDKIPKKLGLAVSNRPMEDFFKIHNHFAKTDFYGKKFLSKISQRAKIHSSVVISDNVEIGDKTIIEPNVVIYPNVKIGENVFLGAGTIIGPSGFEYKKIGKKIVEISHSGGVIIEDDVHIKANCVIDRALFGGNTKIGKATKIDKGVNISHGNLIGERCIITGGVLINGSNQIGKDTYIGPGAVISNGLKIGQGAFISIGSVVVKNVKDKEKVTGNFAVGHEKFLANLIKNNLI